MATVQVNFHTENQDYTMVFGDSYKTWREQLQEYVWMLKNKDILFRITEVFISHSRFIQTGLKWCRFEDYQEELLAIGDKRNPFEFNWEQISLPKVIKL